MTRRTPAHAKLPERRRLGAVVAAVLVVGLLVPAAWFGARSPVPSSAGASGAAVESGQSEEVASFCQAHFEGLGSTVDPVELTNGELYPDLPMPVREGYVFAGWYESAEAAEDLDASQRVNMARMVDCGTPTLLTSGWVTPQENIAEATEVSILMYHFFTTYPGEAEEKERPNLWVEPENFDAHLTYIENSGFYLPSWQELSAFIDGELYLPQRSVIITADDGHETWWEVAAPLLEEHKVMSTSFLVSGRGIGPEGFPYVLRRSHTSSMHSQDGGQEARMVRWSEEEITADLQTSVAELGGVSEVLAYPFGQSNETARAALTAVGFEMGRLAAEGYVTIGTDKLALPIILIGHGVTAEDLSEKIG